MDTAGDAVGSGWAGFGAQDADVDPTRAQRNPQFIWPAPPLMPPARQDAAATGAGEDVAATRSRQCTGTARHDSEAAAAASLGLMQRLNSLKTDFLCRT